ncbi:uncharacterized protein A1O9_03008 [Exophiala aquamarina CBS 119918]|uniref:Uncharacterized protein n=1 Tax=Exophiala aquamarina CBS 119918 TaxID=1182545 RepID=A0A072PNX8_9EURO|nr:uncharacterized protein A1O9_03008 [Exophiala aquamarina CBS 119918]KEF61442.1 hypothetical protein A1O9_03008 [Exophiala aquamarina CBS 119918]
MYRRNNDPEPQMGYHAYPEPTMDDRYLETIHEVESLYSRNSRRSSVHQGLPELPFRAVPPTYERDSVYSNDPVSPVSSHFYQQPATDRNIHNERPTSEPESVSPISSKETLHLHTDSNSSLVSPIEPNFPTAAQQPRSESGKRTQIPKRLPLPIATNLKPEEPAIKKRWSHKATKSGETRWDAYSGEPTDPDKGKPSSYRSAAPQPEPQFPQLKERTRQILAGLKEREAVKKSGWGKSPPPTDDPLDNPVERPAWKGASGRTALVEPVKNTPSARTKPLLLLQRKKPERNVVSPTVEEAEEGSQSPMQDMPAAQSPLATIRTVPSADSLKPVAPLKGRNTPLVLSPTEPESNLRALESPFQSPGPAPQAIFDALPSPAPSAATVLEYGADSPTLGSVASFDPNRANSSQESLGENTKSKPLQRETETASSWNTYATSEVGDYQAAPQSPVSRAQFTSSPVPMNESSTVPPPIMLRKRVAANNSARSYDAYNGVSPFGNIGVRKSSSSILRKAVGADKVRSASMTTGASITKSLPPTPVEASAGDKVSTLEARMEDLARRKRNTNKIINELRGSLKKYAIVYDARKRKEVDKMIINLGMELQEITNEEHETGLRLHRVQKRLDKEDFYEQPTGLWIKRVTT